MTRRPARWLDLVSALALAGALTLALRGAGDYGVTWDELWHIEYGEHVLAWYMSGFEDTSALRFRSDYLYGGGFDLGAALFRRLLGPALSLPAHELNHLFGALVGALGLVGAWRLARRLAGPAAGLCALGLLALTPVYYGHMFNNPKDLPFAVGYVWALYGLARLIHELPRPRPRTWALLACTLGAALCVRVGGLLCACYLLLALALYCAHRAVIARDIEAGLAPALVLMGRAGLAIAGGWALMLATWPWAQLDPLRRPLQALARMTSFNLHHREMPLGARVITSTEPPWDYLPRYFLLKIPLLVWALCVALLVCAALGLLRRARLGRPRVDIRAPLTWALLVFAALFPPCYAAARGSALYDGLRHFLFVVPLLAVFAGCGVVAVARRLARWRVLAGLWLALVSLGAADLARVMIELHPHQYVFFNRLAGGLAGAAGRYETDYYGNSYKRLLTRLVAHLRATEPEVLDGAGYTITGCIPPEVARLYLPDSVRFVDVNARADFFVAYQRQGCLDSRAMYPVIVEEARQGATISVVRDMRGGG